MNTIIITFASQTYAIKAKRLLERNGIGSDLLKIDSKDGHEGCTHGLRFANTDYFDVIAILKIADISYSVYNGK